jgi:hypothetical protein
VDFDKGKKYAWRNWNEKKKKLLSVDVEFRGTPSSARSYLLQVMTTDEVVIRLRAAIVRRPLGFILWQKKKKRGFLLPVDV